MTRLIHLTDLHFGLHHAGFVAPLREAILSNRPDILIVSGDLTQRALASQFRLAMTFLHGLNLKFLVVPGNHDIPVYNPLMRLFNPFGPYRKGASADLTPMMQTGPLRLFGVNTADPFRWRGGVARKAEIERVCQSMREGPEDAINILVCHHPLQEPQGFQRKETRGAILALDRLADAGLDVVLSGHLHHWTTGLGMEKGAAAPIFQMQTGTALCAREGESNHGFAVMDFDAGQLTVTPWIIDDPGLQFRPRQSVSFSYRNGVWKAMPSHFVS